MQLYANRGRNSGVIGFELGDDSITVQFKDRSIYLYTYGSTGSFEIEQMKSLALYGQGLNSYIGRIIRKRFARKLA